MQFGIGKHEITHNFGEETSWNNENQIRRQYPNRSYSSRLWES